MGGARCPLVQRCLRLLEAILRLVVAEVVDLTEAVDTDLNRIEAADELVGEERTAPYVFAPGVVNTWFRVGPLSGNNPVAVP